MASHVTLVEFGSALRADAVLQRKLHSLSNISIITSAQTTEVIGDGSRVSGMRYIDRTTGTSKLIALEGIFVQIGLLPNTEWLKTLLRCRREARLKSTHAVRLPCLASLLRAM